MTSSKLIAIALVFQAGLSAAQTQDKEREKEKDKERPFQLTFIPPIGTNGIECIRTTNRVSLNVLGGLNKGLNGLELGVFANVLLKDMKGVQMAGFTNVVLGNSKGAQMAGYVNYSGGSFEGGAFSGFANVNRGKLTGGQFAGFCNVNLDSLKGGQLAGFCNYNHRQVKGLQGSGFANLAMGGVQGAQLSGFANLAAGDVKGVQASAFFNYAKKVKGLQLGIINIADSVDGASIGLLNLVRKGLHQAEVSVDELFYANLAFRTGTYRFYNVFSAGATSRPGGFSWNIGYGIGTSAKITEKLRTDITVSAHHVSNGLFYHGTSEMYRVYLGVEYKLADKCFIAAGPTFNLYFSDALLPAYDKTYSKMTPYSLFNETNSEGFNFKGWIGAKIAIRFL
jgi:hypothetical protein